MGVDWSMSVLRTMSVYMSLLSMLVPHLGLVDLSMSVLEPMSMCMSPLSILMLHPGSPTPSLTTTFVSIVDVHPLLITCSIGGGESTFNTDFRERFWVFDNTASTSKPLVSISQMFKAKGFISNLSMFSTLSLTIQSVMREARNRFNFLKACPCCDS